MTQLKVNTVANFLGRGWYAAMSLLFVPMYIRFLGMEAYGLVGFFASLQLLFAMFDFGLGATFTREVARYSESEDRAQDASDLTRTLEIVYWTVGIVLGGLICVLSGLIATKWVRADRLNATSIRNAVILMGLVLMLQWPSNLYAGGLRGLQRQVLLNVISVGVATIRGVGAVLVLWLVSPSINAFFGWQVLVSSLATLTMGLCLWLCLRQAGQHPRVRFGMLKTVWSFAAGISIMSVSILLLGQLDKIVLSKVLSLTAFGYYSLASTVATALSIPIAPISEALFPKMSQLAARSDDVELGRLYHRGAQLAALVLFPTMAVVLFFPREVLLLWTGNEVVAANAHALAALLSLGVALNFGAMGMLDLLQMSCGWLKPTVYSRILALLLAGPLMIWMCLSYGALGAAISWLIVYCSYPLLTPHFVFRRLLRAEKWSWYLYDFGLPLAVAVGTAGLGRVLAASPTDRRSLLLFLSCILGVVLLAVAGSMDYTRLLIANTLRRWTRSLATS